GFVYADSYIVSEQGAVLGRYSDRHRLPAGDVFDELVAKSVIPVSTIVVPRRTFLDAGGFRAFRYVEDLDLILRVAVAHPIDVVTEPLSRYRLHDESTSRTLGIEVATD